MPQNSPEETARLRRILPERAIALAMQSRWTEAVDVNKAILAIDPNDADAHNRLGKAQLELGNYREAYEAYKRAVELAPGNPIAQKNMQRLAPLAQQPAGGAAAVAKRPAARPGERINPHTFIEETGKTGLTHLTDLASGPTLLAHHIPLTVAFEILMTGDPLKAEEALRIGLVSRVVPPEELAATAASLAARINENAPMAVRAIKEATRRGLGLEVPERVRLARAVSDRLAGSADAIEGLAAFSEKRKPVWQGR